MLEGKRKVNYVGWLGEGNLGDEAVYQAIRELLGCFALVPASMNYADYSGVSPVTIIGDSTGIPEWLETIRPTKFNYVFGSGVKDPLFFGYRYVYRESLKCSIAISRLKIFKGIGVRGETSRDLLAKWGIKSEVVGDVSFSLRPNRFVKRVDNKIVIAIGSDGILWGMDEERLFGETAKVCRNLKREGYELVLLPFWTRNLPRLKKFASEERITLFDRWFDIQSSLDLMASCKIVIGEKLHSLGLSAAAGTPFVGLEYQPKCRELAQSVGFEKFIIRTDLASEECLMRLFNDLSNVYDEMKDLLDEKVEFYRRKQKSFASRIIHDVETLPEHYWKVPRFNRLVNDFFWKADIVFYGKSPLWYAWNRMFFSRTMRNFV